MREITENVSEFLDSHLHPIMRSGLLFIKDSGNFISKIKWLGSVTENVILVTSDVVKLYTSIPHDMVFKELQRALDKRGQKNFQQEIF